MNVEYPNGLREKYSGLTAEQVAEETKKAIDGGATRIEITTTRTERRLEKKAERKAAKREARKEKNR